MNMSHGRALGGLHLFYPMLTVAAGCCHFGHCPVSARSLTVMNPYLQTDPRAPLKYDVMDRQESDSIK